MILIGLTFLVTMVVVFLFVHISIWAILYGGERNRG